MKVWYDSLLCREIWPAGVVIIIRACQLQEISCVVSVGYTKNDIEGAHASGIQCVAVASHHFNVEQLCEAGTDGAIRTLDEALSL